MSKTDNYTQEQAREMYEALHALIKRPNGIAEHAQAVAALSKAQGRNE